MQESQGLSGGPVIEQWSELSEAAEVAGSHDVERWWLEVSREVQERDDLG